MNVANITTDEAGTEVVQLPVMGEEKYAFRSSASVLLTLDEVSTIYPGAPDTVETEAVSEIALRKSPGTPADGESETLACEFVLV